MEKSYISRLIGEKAELEETLTNEGFRDGVAYAENAPYRELMRIDKMVDAYGIDSGRAEINANLLACTACEVECPDCDTRNWIETILSPCWQDEEEYLRGFVEGVRKILSEVDSAESKKD